MNLGRTSQPISDIVTRRSNRSRRSSRAALMTKKRDGRVVCKSMEATSLFALAMMKQSSYTRTGKVASQSVSIVDLSDYIGYTASFTEVVPLDSTAAIVKDMDNLSVGPVRTHQRKQTSYFTPYSTGRHSQKSGSPVEATIRSVPNRSPKSKKLESSKSHVERQPSPWGKLLSKTDNRPDILLFTDSTGVGKFLNHIDVLTGQRATDYSNPTSSRFC
jgi:hypothetical protein